MRKVRNGFSRAYSQYSCPTSMQRRRTRCATGVKTDEWKRAVRLLKLRIWRNVAAQGESHFLSLQHITMRKTSLEKTPQRPGSLKFLVPGESGYPTSNGMCLPRRYNIWAVSWDCEFYRTSPRCSFDRTSCRNDIRCIFSSASTACWSQRQATARRG